MATYERRERTTRWVEFVVPTRPPQGAAWVEVMNAIRAATTELVAAERVLEGDDPPYDMLRIHTEDDAVVVSYETTTTRGT